MNTPTRSLCLLLSTIFLAIAGFVTVAAAASIETFPAAATRPIYFTGPPRAVRAQAFVGDAAI